LFFFSPTNYIPVPFPTVCPSLRATISLSFASSLHLLASHSYSFFSVLPRSLVFIVLVQNTRENRQAYRHLLFTTAGLSEYISGCITYEETLFEKDASGKSYAQILSDNGIIPGIKVDKGVVPLANTDGETVTQGIDGLGKRCAEYYAAGCVFLAIASCIIFFMNSYCFCMFPSLSRLSYPIHFFLFSCSLLSFLFVFICFVHLLYVVGCVFFFSARFAKWRAVLCIKDSGAPTQLSIDANAYTLARYASICQENGLVPIVEPEILMDGTHSIERSAEVTQRVLAATFKALADHHVILEGCLLKPNMVRSGTSCIQQATSADIARCTVRVLQNTVPPALPGVTFLSGGMSEEDATVALDCINKFGEKSKKPWSLTFSYGRALQKSVLAAWKGDSANIAAAQEQLMIRSKANSEAQRGIYAGSGKEGAAASASLHVANYSY